MYQSRTCNTRVACKRQSTRRCVYSKLYHSTWPWISLSTAHTISNSDKSAAGIGRVKVPDKVFLQTNKFDQKYKHCGGANLHLSESANLPGAPRPEMQEARFVQNPSSTKSLQCTKVVPATLRLHASGNLPGGVCTRNCTILHVHGSRYLPHTQSQKATTVPQVLSE